MGQKTQILVIRENAQGEKKAKFYHHQWGFGRVMYLALIDCFINDYNKDTFVDEYNFIDNKNFGCFDKNLTNITPSKQKTKFDRELTDVLNSIDVKDINTIKRVFKCKDNNNGGLVIYIKEDKECKYNSADFTIGFLLGNEDSYRYEGKVRIDIEEPFSRWLIPEEYGKMNGGSKYSDENFVKIFTDFCKYFGIKYFEN